MNPPPSALGREELASRFLITRRALAAEAPDALDRMAALAERALAARDLPLAAAAAGAVVLTEHLQSALYRHAARMLVVLAAAGPDAGADGSDGLFAWAGAAVAHDYGVLPSWPRADVAMLIERTRNAPTDVALALGCALGEVCERNGEDAEFAALRARMAAFAVQPGASPFWRGHWAIVCAWQLASFGRTIDARQQLETAQALAAAHGLVGLGATAALQRARLVEWRDDPARAVLLAEQAVAVGDASRTPLWLADQADVCCRVALQAQDFHAAIGHSRRAVGQLQAGAVWPGFQITYRVNEAYALLGIGAFDDALACLASLRETPCPRYLAGRLQTLADLAALVAADQHGQWSNAQQPSLASAVRSLRELEWPNVLPFLPRHVARLFAKALASGIEPDWVRAAIRLRALPAPPGAPEAWPWAVRLRTLGGFELETDSGASPGRARDARKASSKPLELLRCLAAQGREAASVDAIAQVLWAGDGREGRQKAFDITVARLRRLLDCDRAVIVHDHRAGLNAEFVWVDAWSLSDRLAQAEAAAEGSAVARAALEAALTLYRGPFLADSTQPWARGTALLRAMRGAAASQGLEWTLRATAADVQIGPLLGPEGS
jgi:hypothetical protein